MLEALVDAIDRLVRGQYRDPERVAINPPIQYGWVHGDNWLNLIYRSPDTIVILRSAVGGEIAPELCYLVEAESTRQIADRIVNWLNFRPLRRSIRYRSVCAIFRYG